MKPLVEWAFPVARIASAIYLVLFGLIWFLTPAKALAAGFLLGGLISLYNVYHLYFRMKIVGLRIRSGRRPVGLNMTVRILTVVFGVLMVYRFPTRIDYRSFVLSLLFGYLLMVTVVSIYYLKKGNTTSPNERRETLGSDSESTFSRNDV
ncbi:MAG: ATP synthase subunit I [Sporolactobacillus sp.]